MKKKLGWINASGTKIKKTLFKKLSVSDLLRQVTIVALFTAIGVVVDKSLPHFDWGVYHISFGSVVLALLMPLFVDLRLAIMGSITLVTLGELFWGHGNFWISYLPMIFVVLIIKFFQLFKNMWFDIIGIIIALTQFALLKAFIYYLVYSQGDDAALYGISGLIGGFIQIGIGLPIALILYIPLYKIMPKLIQKTASYS